MADIEDRTRTRAKRYEPQIPTYYGQPALKPSYYGGLAIAYLFIGGLASACQFIAAAVDLFGRSEDRSIVRSGRYLALVGALISPFLLIADLHRPQRWYNMLRIGRRTSPMSIGSWALFTFGIFSGFAAVGQFVEDLFGWRIGGAAARLFGLPAAVAGGVVSLYTGTLLAATSIPLWASASPFLSSLFASSAASTATAALTLAADASSAPSETRRRLSLFALLAGLAELLFASQIDRQWRSARTETPVQSGPLGAAWRFGVLGLGISVPLGLHALELAQRRPGRALPRLAAVSTLVGGYLLRAVFIRGGNASAGRAEDYFRMTQRQTRS